MNIYAQENYNSVSETSGDRFYKQEKTNAENQFELVYLALNALKDATNKRLKSGQVENILSQVLWPETRNLIEKAEAICNAQMKKILASYLLTEDDAVEVNPNANNLGKCLSTLLLLGELST